METDRSLLFSLGALCVVVVAGLVAIMVTDANFGPATETEHLSYPAQCVRLAEAYEDTGKVVKTIQYDEGDYPSQSICYLKFADGEEVSYPVSDLKQRLVEVELLAKVK